MAKHDDINASIIKDQDEAWVIDSIVKAMPPPSSSPRIRRVPEILLRETGDYNKYYVPKVVSIGPYHYGNPKLQSVEKVKPIFTKKLLSQSGYESDVGLSLLYKKLGEVNVVQELRKLFIYGEIAGTCEELRSHQIVFIHQDLFLLENQIPFRVLNEVIDLIKFDRRDKILSFFADNILLPGRQKRGWFGFGSSCSSTLNDRNYRLGLYGSFTFIGDHLLHRLHSRLTQTSETHMAQYYSYRPKNELSSWCTFRNVSELVEVGIHFKPSSVMSLAHVEFIRRWWWLSADVKLPPITVDDSTKPMLLNLIAYEMCLHDPRAWVTSYICLLDSLIDQPEDVKALRKAGVIDNSLGSDNEVATLFNEIATGLVPNNVAYSKAKNHIQSQYESLRNTWISQLKHEYIKSPWAFLALVGAVLALFLSGVQTYYTVWSPKG